MAHSPPTTLQLNETIIVVAFYGDSVGVPLTQAQIEYQLSHYYESRVAGLIAGTVVLLVATSMAVLLRMLSRRLKKVPLGVDDYMAATGLIFFYGYATSFFILIRYGLGVHSFRAGAYKFEHIGKCFYVFQCLYAPVCFTTKMSVLFLYRRIFTITSKAWDISWWTISCLYFVFSLANFFKDVFEAVPVRAVWELVPNAHWIHPIEAFWITGTINIILTAAILVLPMPIVWGMKMSRAKKVGLCGLFALGCGDVAVIIGRTIVLRFEQFPNTDFTWSVCPTAMLSIIEQAIGILCASLPMTRALFVHKFHSHKGSSNYMSTPKQPSGTTSTQSSSKNRGFRTLIDETAYPPDFERAARDSTYRDDIEKMRSIPLATIKGLDAPTFPGAPSLPQKSLSSASQKDWPPNWFDTKGDESIQR